MVPTRLAGAPAGFPLTAADAVTGIADGTFPVVPRAGGVIFGFFVSFSGVNHHDREAITSPGPDRVRRLRPGRLRRRGPAGR
jgi:hypothetical protein